MWTTQSPPKVSGGATSNDERDPWISDDQLRLYFALGTSSSHRLHVATRMSVLEDFGAASELESISATGLTDDSRPALTSDENTLVLSSNRGGLYDLYVATRSNMMGSFSSQLTSLSVNSARDSFDPFLSSDGQWLYFAPADAAGDQHLMVAPRTADSVDYDGAVPAGVEPRTGVTDADPALSKDERILMFSSNRPAGTGNRRLWYAVRADPSQPFATAVQIPFIAGDSDDNDPVLSADGCTLYFASNRTGSQHYDLYMAQLVQ